jgi:adenylosuccinate synthase
VPVTIVVGGQFGSEGKGKVALFLSAEMGAKIAIRVGGPNSGHTVIGPNGRRCILRQLPTASLIPSVTTVLPPGSYIRVETLRAELAMTGASTERVIVDPKAVVIDDADIESEAATGIRRAIGSTGTGIGAAAVRRIGRVGRPTFASDVPELSHLVRDSGPLLRKALSRNERIVLEGTQGFGLSVLHSPFYPYVTARDTTAAGFLSEAGLSPLDVDDVVLVLRAFPIRVPGTSGPLPNEVDWTLVTEESGSDEPILERTSVTNTVRRVARFDQAIVNRAVQANDPTRLVLNHLDHIDSRCRDAHRLTDKADWFVSRVESALNRKVDYAGTGPGTMFSLHPLRSSARKEMSSWSSRAR